MQSKRKNKKNKAASRRGEKALVFFKRATMVLLAVVVTAASVLGLKIFSERLRVEDIIISGNSRLEREDVLNSLKVRRGESLLALHFSEIRGRLKANSWIKKVDVRKQYPDTLEIRIEEAEPKALLSLNDQLYLVDGNGNRLESIKGETTPFLPVIKNIDPGLKKEMDEALKLVGVLSGKSAFADRESIEVGLESYGLAVHIDGEFIKVGYGDYEEKFQRWIELEPEIRKRGLPVQYVDLRFKDSVIVKPVEEEKTAKKEKGKALS
ncbi:MAG: FtsQ-type POTRA domain-containing protein [Nitrospirae bacterium]|nr:FtsQ-type POTRA domain-containing protein [Nitrospirota bacterium]